MQPVAHSELPTRHGVLTFTVWEHEGLEPMTLSSGTVSDGALVRVHSGCVTGDLFGSTRCDCGAQLDTALDQIASSGNGIMIYLKEHEGRGIGLINKLRAYALQDQGVDTLAANHQLGLPGDARNYEAAVKILDHLGVASIRLITNNPAKIEALEQGGITIAERVPLWIGQHANNARYLSDKKKLMGHME